MPRHAVPVCGLCQATEGPDGFVQCASEGSLLAVCRRCFYLQQIRELSAGLPAGDGTAAIVEDGLRTLYELVKARAEELVLSQIRDASEARSGSEGR
jgi:hypothetical protein